MPAASDFCTLSQQSLNAIARDNYGLIKRDRVGLLDGLISDTNTSGFEQVQVDAGNGKVRKVKIRYAQPLAESLIVTEEPSVCVEDHEPTPLEDEVEITNGMYTPVLTFDDAQMRQYCEGASEWRAMQINGAMNAFFNRLNKAVIAQYIAKHGVFVDGTPAPKPIPLINQAVSGQFSIDPWGESVMSEDFADMGGSTEMLVAGAGLLAHYANLKGIGCCNSLGQNLANVGDFQFYHDKAVDGVSGTTNSVLAWQPGAMQFLQWLKNKGEFAVATPLYAKTTIVDPVTGIELDITVRYDECTEKWNIYLGTKYELFALPDDMYAATDDKYQTNGALFYQAITS